MKRTLELLLLLSFSFILLYTISPVFSAWSSGVYGNIKQFNVTPDVVYLNWTNNYTSNITITVNGTFGNVTVEILNSSVFAVNNYSQSNSNSFCSPGGTYGYRIFTIDRNYSNGYNSTLNMSLTGSLTSLNSTVVGLIDTDFVFNHRACAPGRYWISSLTIRNITNSTENANISVAIDIPISSVNGDKLITTGIANFSGTIPTCSTVYHSYYFNATSAFNSNDTKNITGVSINLTGWSSSQNLDMFLFDSSNKLLAKSINRSGTTEWLYYKYMPNSAAMWEIRIYGNSSNTSGIPYSGFLIFSTLNATNATDTDVTKGVWDPVTSSINFGTLNASAINTTNMTLINTGGFQLSNVAETKQLYYIKRFSNSTRHNYTFVVPGSSAINKIKVELNWTGSANYSFTLFKPNGVVAATSVNKFPNANVTNATQEEYNETTDTVGGTWKVRVENNAQAESNYNLTVYQYYPASTWIATNYTIKNFNTSNQNNSQYLVQVNLTVQNNSMDGDYEGYIQYMADSGATLRVPIRFIVRSESFTINGSYDSATVQIDENIGSHLVGNSAKLLGINLNNTGTYALSLTNISSNTLNLTGDNTKYINFTFNASAIPDVVNAGVNRLMNVTIPINITTTQNTTGLYVGWINFTANNSHPYQGFNLTLIVNLTDEVVVNIGGMRSFMGNSTVSNISNTDENVTANFTIYYVNGTIENGLSTYSFDTGSISSIWLQEGNVTGSSGRLPRTSNLTAASSSNAGAKYISNTYNFSIDVPLNTPGGRYYLHLATNYTRDDGTRLRGEAVSNMSLIINNTGFYMNSTTSSISMANASTTTVTAFIFNTGPLSSDITRIKFDKSTCPLTVTASTVNCQVSSSGAGCSAASSPNYTITNFPAENINATNNLTWSLLGTSSGSCTATIYGGSVWFNNISIPITISATSTNASSSTTTPASGGSTTTTGGSAAAYVDITKYTSLITVLPGSSNSTTVEVKNTNSTISQDMKVNVESIDSAWFSVSPGLTAIAPLSNKTFNVTFTVPATASITDYAGKFRAISNYANTSKDFTLRVLPTQEKKIEINTTFYSYKANFTKFWGEINSSEARGLNVTEARVILVQLKAKIDETENYINQGDYFSANQLLPDINSLLEQGWTALKNAKSGGILNLPKGVLTYALIGTGIVGAFVLAYLFWPTKGEEKKKEPKLETEKEE